MILLIREQAPLTLGLRGSVREVRREIPVPLLPRQDWDGPLGYCVPNTACTLRWCKRPDSGPPGSVDFHPPGRSVQRRFITVAGSRPDKGDTTVLHAKAYASTRELAACKPSFALGYGGHLLRKWWRRREFHASLHSCSEPTVLSHLLQRENSCFPDPFRVQFPCSSIFSGRRCGKIKWWRRRELNPRPSLAFYPQGVRL